MRVILLAIILTLGYSQSILAVAQQEGGTGHIKRMIVNHNASNDEIYITTDDPSPLCAAMYLKSNDPNVSPASYKNLVSYLLAVKMSGKKVQLYTDLSCNLFRAEIID